MILVLKPSWVIAHLHNAGSSERSAGLSLCVPSKNRNHATRDNANEQQKTNHHCYASNFPCLRRRFCATVWLYALAETKPGFSLPASVYIAISVGERQLLCRHRFPPASFVYLTLGRINSSNGGLEDDSSLFRFSLLARIWSFACLKISDISFSRGI